MSYVDGFLAVVPKKNTKAYEAMARKAGKIWMKHGALHYLECRGDDLNFKGVHPTFPKLTKIKPTETVYFSLIVYKSRAHRDAVNKKVMADPDLKAPKKMPFDPKKMTYGGFKTAVEY